MSLHPRANVVEIMNAPKSSVDQSNSESTTSSINGSNDFTFSFHFEQSPLSLSSSYYDEGRSSQRQNNSVVRDDDDMAGYQFLKRSNGKRFVLHDDDSTCTSTANITDSESLSHETDIDSTSKPDEGNERTTQPFGHARTRKSVLFNQTSSPDGLHRNFEEFARKQLEKFERRYERGHHKKQNMSLLFTCKDKINFDFIHAVNVYCTNTNKSNEYSTKSGASVLTEHYDNTTAGRIKRNTNFGGTDEIIDSHLFAASHIVQQFISVVGTFNGTESVFMKPIDESPMSPLQLMYGDMEKYLMTQLSLVGMSDIPTLSPHHTTKLVRWYHWYTETIDSINYDSSIAISPVWKSDTELLVQHYLEKAVRKVMTEIRDRMDNADYTNDSEQDIRETDFGHIVTRLPEDTMHVIDLQVQVAVEHLHQPEYIIQVFQTCLEIIFIFVGTKVDQIQSQWQAMSTKRYCSIINNVTRLSELLDDYRESLVEKYGPSGDTVTARHEGYSTDAFDYWQALDERMDTLGCELAQLAVLATDYLCRRILHRLESSSDLISSAGSRSWEDDSSNSAVEETVESLQEYFASVEEWLYSADYFLPKILQKCFYLTIQAYVESFYNNTQLHGIRQPDIVSVRLRNDYTIFTNYFNGPYFEAHNNRPGKQNSHEALINARLSFLLSMSRIMDPELSPTDLVDDTRNILEHVESDGMAGNKAPAILHLVGLRGGIRSKTDSIQWIQDITWAEQIIQELSDKSISKPTTSFIRLPDLRNSPYIYAIRINQNDLEREFSVGSRDFAQATKDIVTGAGYTKQVQMYLVRKQPKISLSPTSNATDTAIINMTTNITMAAATTIRADAIMAGFRTNREKLSKVLFHQRKPTDVKDIIGEDDKQEEVTKMAEI